MDARPGRAVSSRPRRSGRAARPSAPPSPAEFGALSPGIRVEVGWPERTAVIVGDEKHGQLLATLTRLGIVPIQLHPGAVAAELPSLGTFTFLLLGPDAVRHESAVTLSRAMSGLNATAPTLLVATAAQQDVATLRGAVRAGAGEVLDPDDAVGTELLLSEHLRLAGRGRARVLAVGAHPDDVEIGCAGTLLNHRRRGDRISVLTLSSGAIGGDSGARIDESIASARVLGSQLLMGDLEDTRIDDGRDTIRLIEDVVRVLQPTIVYVHSRHDNHQDHRAVHLATLSATRGVPSIFGYQSPSASGEFSPTKFVSIDDVLDDKLAVLAEFVSQRGRSYLEPDQVTAGARYWARQLPPATRYAEPFETVRSAAGHGSPRARRLRGVGGTADQPAEAVEIVESGKSG